MVESESPREADPRAATTRGSLGMADSVVIPRLNSWGLGKRTPKNRIRRNWCPGVRVAIRGRPMWPCRGVRRGAGSQFPRASAPRSACYLRAPLSFGVRPRAPLAFGHLRSVPPRGSFRRHRLCCGACPSRGPYVSWGVVYRPGFAGRAAHPAGLGICALLRVGTGPSDCLVGYGIPRQTLSAGAGGRVCV